MKKPMGYGKEMKPAMKPAKMDMAKKMAAKKTKPKMK